MYTKRKQVWNYITRDRAKIESESLYNKDEDNVISKLCSSYAWDTALSFIAKTNEDYPTNSTEGNYSGGLKETGQTTAVNNIYDMGGNIWEWTTEVFGFASSSCTLRGGNRYSTASGCPAGYREYVITTNANVLTGYRDTLFL